MNMYILAIIPARSGSKGIKNKNIKIYNDKPLLVHSIDIAIESKYISEVIVSTNSSEYKKIAESHGALVPYLRPEEISLDLSTDFEYLKYHIDWCISNGKKIPDLIVQLRPTYPNRNIKILNETINIMINNYDKYDSLRTVVKFEKSPFKMYRIKDDNLIPLFKKIDDIDEPYNQCRQILPDTYLHNGYIDIIKSDIINKYNSVTGNKIYPYIMNTEETNDIDTLEDWNKSLINK